ncbi:MAG: hypothetical protein VYA34_02540 [Myxococcota bacterium]|nr:hypothetical protein [Myxococcota bacterium]
MTKTLSTLKPNPNQVTATTGMEESQNPTLATKPPGSVAIPMFLGDHLSLESQSTVNATAKPLPQSHPVHLKKVKPSLEHQQSKPFPRLKSTIYTLKQLACQNAARKEITSELLRQANQCSLHLNSIIPPERVYEAQSKFIENRVGVLYPHPRDLQAWNNLKEDAPIHTFLPGYATGDRYTAVLSMLKEPRMRIIIAYENHNPSQRRKTIEVYDWLEKTLASNGIESLQNRISLVKYNGDLKNARKELNTHQARIHFSHVRGFESPLSRSMPENENTHVFHISISTVIMAQAWGDNYSKGDTLQQNSQKIRNYITNMIPQDTQEYIDAIVKHYLRETRIEPGSVALWVANRPNPNAREAEGIFNPAMFEQIREKLAQEGVRVFSLADGFTNHVKNRTENRHPYQPHNRQKIGKFWEHHPLLRTRENQWYFLDRLLTTLKCPALIGIRSGALEPTSLMGHNVIYLEHDDMFTPERHGAWQGRIPYNRLVTQARTGYFNAEHEILRDQKIKALLSENLKRKQQLGPQPEACLSKSDLQQQSDISRITNVIKSGVLLPAELELLITMVKKPQPAFKIKP